MSDQAGLRVAHIIDSLGRGGAEHALLNLAPEFNNHNIELIVVSLFSDNSLQKNFADLGIEVVNMNFSHKWQILKNTRLITEFLKSRNIKIAHAHLIFSGIYVGLTKFFGLEVSRVISLHNLAYAKGCNPINTSYFLRKTLNWIVLRFCYDQVLAVSQAVATHYRFHFGLGEKRIAVLANGLPVSDYEKYLSNNNGEQKSLLKVLALGRLVKEKGYEYLLSAFAEIKKARDKDDLELCIIGGGPLEKSLQEQAEQLKISDSVRFVGSIAHDDAMRELSNADVYVLSSTFEGFGLAVAEAVLLEKPVVATRVGGVLDIVSDETAVLVEPADTISLQKGIDRAICFSERERQQKVKIAKAEVIENYSVSKIACQLSGIYRAMEKTRKSCSCKKSQTKGPEKNG